MKDLSSLRAEHKMNTLLVRESLSLVATRVHAARHRTDVCATPANESPPVLLHKLVAHSMYGDEMRGLLRVLFQLSADIGDVGLHRV